MRNKAILATDLVFTNPSENLLIGFSYSFNGKLERERPIVTIKAEGDIKLILQYLNYEVFIFIHELTDEMYKRMNVGNECSAVFEIVIAKAYAKKYISKNHIE